MIVYFDMDGVISDLDGTIAEALDEDLHHIEADRAFRQSCYQRWFESLDRNLERGYSNLRTHHLEENRALIREIAALGHQVELLSSLGIHRGLFPMDVLTLGTQIHRGKTNWLARHYLDLFEEGTLHRFNTVPNCEQKRCHASPGSVLLDDQEENVKGFVASGGRGVHYNYRRRAECVAELRGML